MISDNRVSSNERTSVLRVCVVGLFFLWGFSTVLNDTLVPRFKALFALSYAQVMLTQFAFFLAYFICSVPAGLLVARIGYVRSIVVGLAIMTAGCLLFVPASAAVVYTLFLVALFVVAAGISVLQVAANPFIAQLGPSATSHSRLNLAQAFNSLGTFVGPYFGAWLILGAVPGASAGTPSTAIERAQQAHALQLPFVIIAGVLAVALVVFAMFWNRSGIVASAPQRQAGIGEAFALLGNPRTAFGALAIFVYVGAEVTIGSLMINYLMSPHTLGLAAVSAGRMVSLYWGGAMVGRLVGAALLRRVNASVLLSACAIGAALLATLSGLSSGAVAAAAALTVGLCNSIMFPTIFSLSIEGLGERAPQGAALLCLAIVGGAIIPPLAGKVADLSSLSVSLFVPVLCYIWISIFGVLTRTRALAVRL
ncbi:MAG TPA: sugar MFS transporter [Steroidobacteraceae bacterium]|jgi:FHS family L-fucose permease-like MFS transporter|nr:sugar MFS transporter [Steroidobacteraceae bacterium]